MVHVSVGDILWLCTFLSHTHTHLSFCPCPSQISIMTNKKTKVKFSWLHTAFISPSKFQKNDAGLARPTRWGGDASGNSSKDSTPNVDTSTSSVELGELKNIKLGTPQGRLLTPSQTQGTQKTHRMSSRPCRLFKNAEVTSASQCCPLNSILWFIVTCVFVFFR